MAAAIAAATALVTGASMTTVATTADAASRAATSTTVGRPAPPRTVTLPTGDQVVVRTAAAGRVTATVPAPRPGSAPFRTFRAGQHLFVLPRSAVSKIGRSWPLSRFDVTAAGTRDVRPDFAMHTLTVKGLDAAGRLDTGDGVTVSNIDDVRKFYGFQSFYKGQLKFSVPNGHYSATSFFFPSALGGQVRIVVLPQFTVAGDTTITVDARTATSRVSVSTPRPAQLDSVEITIAQVDAHGGTAANILGFGPGFDIYVSPTRPVTVGQLHYYAYWRLIARNGSYTYDLEFPADGAIPAAQRYTVAATALATVNSRYYSEIARTGLETRFSFLPWQTFAFRSLFPLSQPGRRTEYVIVNPDLVWQQNVFAYVAPRAPVLAGLLIESDRTYPTRQSLTSQWNKQPMHPGVQADLGPTIGNVFVCPACRIGDKLGLVIWPFADNQLGHYGFPDSAAPEVTEKLSAAVYQNGVKVAATPLLLGLFKVTRAPATYRLAQDTVRRSAYFTLSTKTHSEWTFRSGHHAGAGTLPPGWYCLTGSTHCSVLPLMTARYDLPLTLSDRLAAGATSFTLDVQHLQGATALPVTAAAVSVSYDDGASWHRVASRNLGSGHFRVTYRTPARSATNGYVALRISASDAAGGQLEQQILRAYALS